MIIRSSSGKKCFAFLQGLDSVVLGPLDLCYPSKCLLSTVSGLFSQRFTQHGDISTVMVYTILLTQHTDPAKSGYNIFVGYVIVWAVNFIYKHTNRKSSLQFLFLLL